MAWWAGLERFPFGDGPELADELLGGHSSFMSPLCEVRLRITSPHQGRLYTL